MSDNVTAEKRFSKGKLIATLEARVIALQTLHRFDPMNGWAQVHGRGEETNRIYGEYSAMKHLLSQVRDNWL